MIIMLMLRLFSWGHILKGGVISLRPFHENYLKIEKFTITWSLENERNTNILLL